MAKITPMKFTILGQSVSMKNSRQLVYNKSTGKRMFIKSKKALIYEKTFLVQIPPKFKLNIESRVIVRIVAYYASERSDLDCELICDCLQKGRVLKNDRQIIVKHFEKRIDKDNPRAEIEIIEHNIDISEG